MSIKTILPKVNRNFFTNCFYSSQESKLVPTPIAMGQWCINKRQWKSYLRFMGRKNMKAIQDILQSMKDWTTHLSTLQGACYSFYCNGIEFGIHTFIARMLEEIFKSPCISTIYGNLWLHDISTIFPRYMVTYGSDLVLNFLKLLSSWDDVTLK